jgi:hypothetical protein
MKLLLITPMGKTCLFDGDALARRWGARRVAIQISTAYGEARLELDLVEGRELMKVIEEMLIDAAGDQMTDAKAPGS